MSPFRAALGAASFVLLAGCSSFGGVRPRYGPLPDAKILFLDGRLSPAAATINLLEARVRAAGLGVERVLAAEGYLETRWWDLDARRTVGAPFSRQDRVVKLRFFADPVSGQTRLVAECVVLVAWDRSVPERELERVVTVGHPGRALLDSVLTAVSDSL